jgi:hypothetical protein
MSSAAGSEERAGGAVGRDCAGVGQDEILRAIVNRAGPVFAIVQGRFDNRPQVDNLPHKLQNRLSG